jgi:8-oxo-dGTP pyrophosphatase MutT (NUDIX family)/GNAT superfamily N-acetyltransferase
MNASFISPYCISAYVICKTVDGPRYLLIRRCGPYLFGTWQMVTGGIEKGETAWQAALREIHEETGLETSKMYCADAVETFYVQTRDRITYVPVFVAFVDQTDVRLSPSEHDAYEWLHFEEAQKRLSWAEQRRTIAEIHERYVLQTPNELHAIPIGSQLMNQGSSANRYQLDITIRPMNAQDIDHVSDLYLPWSTRQDTHARWEKYHKEQQQNIRTVAVIEKDNQILGYGSLLRLSKYPYFSNTPEISDVWIYEQHRRQGFGKQLLLWLEDLARREKYTQIGIGVGLYKDYGPAQQLYFQLGYKPDGNGITYKHMAVVPGEPYPVDDNLIFWLIKSLLNNDLQQSEKT